MSDAGPMFRGTTGPAWENPVLCPIDLSRYRPCRSPHSHEGRARRRVPAVTSVVPRHAPVHNRRVRSPLREGRVFRPPSSVLGAAGRPLRRCFGDVVWGRTASRSSGSTAASIGRSTAVLPGVDQTVSGAAGVASPLAAVLAEHDRGNAEQQRGGQQPGPEYHHRRRGSRRAVVMAGGCGHDARPPFTFYRHRLPDRAVRASGLRLHRRPTILVRGRCHLSTASQDRRPPAAQGRQLEQATAPDPTAGLGPSGWLPGGNGAAPGPAMVHRRDPDTASRFGR